MLVEVENISKSYGKVEAIKDVQFSIESGEIFGLIGPDGAGKTTIIRILATLLLPDSGSASINGFDTEKDMFKIRELLGYMPGKFSLYPDLTIKENINLFASVFGTTLAENYHTIKDIYSQIEMFEDRPAGKLSGGMKQKLALSCALVHKPILLLLDEPTTGVDPVSRKEFWDILLKLKEQGLTILVSTPYMDEAARCDRIALIDKGSIFTIDKPVNIVDSYQKTIYNIESSSEVSKFTILETFNSNKDLGNIYASGEYIKFVPRDEQSFTKLNNLIGMEINYLQTKPDIEDCFIQFVKENEK